ncbi:MAG: hypothetical protein QM783_08075 [Phycisphaerales bacterium]
MSDLVHDILRELLWDLFWPPVRDWCEARRGESVEANWRRCGIWFAPFFAFFGCVALLGGILGGGWIWAMCGPIAAACTWVVGRWLVAIRRCERAARDVIDVSTPSSHAGMRRRESGPRERRVLRRA